jgi:YegS/Rv2252/BmrU family lipid kinase
MHFSGITFIINALRSISPDISVLIDDCQKLLSEIDIKYTEFQGHAYNLAKIDAAKDKHLIIAVGGDGTFNEVVNGVADSGNVNAVIALIPNGTGNDFCKAQGILFSGQSMIEMIKNPAPVTIDLGMITSGLKSRYFLNIADIGFGGYATKLLDSQRQKGLNGGLSYHVAILRAFISYRKPIAKVMVDDIQIYEGPLMMLAICNSSTFGHGLVIHPGARPDDGILNISLLGRITFWDYISNLIQLKKGKKIHHPAICYMTGMAIEVISSDKFAAIETDGETFGEGSVKVSVVPKCIKLLNKLPTGF